MIAKSLFPALDVQDFLDIATEVNDFFFVMQTLSDFVNKLEFRLALEIFGDDKFCHFANWKLADVIAEKFKILVDFEESFHKFLIVCVIALEFSV